MLLCALSRRFAALSPPLTPSTHCLFNLFYHRTRILHRRTTQRHFIDSGYIPLLHSFGTGLGYRRSYTSQFCVHHDDIVTSAILDLPCLYRLPLQQYVPFCGEYLTVKNFVARGRRRPRGLSASLCAIFTSPSSFLRMAEEGHLMPALRRCDAS